MSKILLAFENPAYRWMWLASLTNAFSFMPLVMALGWLLLEITNSPFIVGLAIGLGGIASMIFSPFAGVLVDRLNRRTVMISSQLLMGLPIFIVGILVVFESIEVWQLILASILSGIARAFSNTARSTLTFDIVGRKTIMNAMAGQFISFQIAGIIGPLSAGYIMQAYGPGHLLLVISLSLFISAICVLPIPNLKTKSTPTGSIWRNFKAGLEFVLHDNPIRTVMIVLLFTEGLGFACWSMFPVVARDVLHAGPVVLGFLSTFRSLGGIIGAITVSASGDIKPKGWVLIGADIIFGMFLIFFAFSSNLVMSLALIMIVGAFGTTVSTISSTLAQTMAPEEMRGRVMGLHGFITSSFGLGSLVIGTLANFLGVSWAIAIGGASVSSNAIRSIPKAKIIGERSSSR